MRFELQELVPMLETQNLEASIRFYTELLGFTLIGHLPGEWANLRRDRVRLMLSAPNIHRNIPYPVFSGSLYLYTNDVEEAWKSLKDCVPVCYPIETFDYGMREFAIYDNNGYLIQFGQEVEVEEAIN